MSSIKSMHLLWGFDAIPAICSRLKPIGDDHVIWAQENVKQCYSMSRSALGCSHGTLRFRLPVRTSPANLWQDVSLVKLCKTHNPRFSRDAAPKTTMAYGKAAVMGFAILLCGVAPPMTSLITFTCGERQQTRCKDHSSRRNPQNKEVNSGMPRNNSHPPQAKWQELGLDVPHTAGITVQLLKGWFQLGANLKYTCTSFCFTWQVLRPESLDIAGAKPSAKRKQGTQVLVKYLACAQFFGEWSFLGDLICNGASRRFLGLEHAAAISEIVGWQWLRSLPALRMKVWNPHVLCDGVPAGHRAAWCIDHLGLLVRRFDLNSLNSLNSLNIFRASIGFSPSRHPVGVRPEFRRSPWASSGGVSAQVSWPPVWSRPR